MLYIWLNYISWHFATSGNKVVNLKGFIFYRMSIAILSELVASSQTSAFRIDISHLVQLFSLCTVSCLSCQYAFLRIDLCCSQCSAKPSSTHVGPLCHYTTRSLTVVVNNPDVYQSPLAYLSIINTSTRSVVFEFWLHRWASCLVIRLCAQLDTGLFTVVNIESPETHI
jgi:hypothetical protein